jgi:hypothetical protein
MWQSSVATDPFGKLDALYFGRLDLILGQLKNDFRVYGDTYFNANQSPGRHDEFFGRFTPIWLDLVRKHRYFEAAKLWQLAIGLAIDWEVRNKPNQIHKGTPYYFLGVTAILNNELENGFLSMHQALIEDKRLSGRRIPEAPAFWFVILDFSRQDQFFKPKVEQMATYLSERLNEYSTKRAGSLTLIQFRKRFLRRRKLNEEVFLFVYSLFKLRKLILETDKIYKRNVLSSLLHAKLLFDLSMITEKAIEYKNPRKGKGRKLVFADELLFLSAAPARLLSFNTGNRIGKLNSDFEKDFAGTLYDILNKKYPLGLSDIENDFAIAYGVRNFGAHKIENKPVLYSRTPALAQSILNTLFFAIEKLY